MFSDIHCSLADGRSFTDPVSNWTVISGVDLDHDLANMLQAGQYPVRFLPDFLHEFVHHWCFRSLVGSALALLQLRVRRRVALLAEHGEAALTTDAIIPIVEDIARYEAAISLLRPLTEGLALFAEFDMTPGGTRTLSAAAAMTMTHFTDTPEGASDETARLTALTRRLWTERLGTAFVDRKANLLVQPLSVSGAGYLPGYLTVKNLRYALYHQTQSDKLLDADFYLMFVRTFFYEDMGLVATLLDPQTRLDPWHEVPTDSVRALSMYFQRRFSQLVTWTSSADLDRFEAVTLDRQASTDARTRLATAPELAALGQQRLQAAVDELRVEGPVDDLDKSLRLNDQWLLVQRDLMCIASFKAPVRVNEHHRATVGEYKAGPRDFRFPVCALQALPDAPPSEGDGSLEVFVSAAGMYSFLTVWLNDRIVAIFPLGEGAQEILARNGEDIARYRTSLEEATRLRDLSLAAVSRVLEEDAEGMFYLEHYRTQVGRVADAFYGVKALLFVDDASVAACAAEMRERGVYDIFGGDYALIRTLALLSLTNSVDMSRDFAAEVLKGRGLDLDPILASLQRYGAPYGFAAVHEIQAAAKSTLFCVV